MENNNPQKITTENNQETIFTEQDFSLEGYDKHIKQARSAIFLAAGLLFLNTVVLYFTSPDYYEYLWIDIAFWGVFIAGFIALGFWTKKKPYSAIVGALILYALFVIINAAMDVSTIFKGILFKIAIIVFLVKGLKDAKLAQEMRQQMEQ